LPSRFDPSPDACARPPVTLLLAPSPASELSEQIASAAKLMHSPADPGAIADAIEAVPADAWDEATLGSLRSAALDIGRLLRAIAAVAEGDTDDDD
jgi:hypothetical protein